jgi:hypothetical protein
MRCYFMRNGHINAVEELFGLSEEEATAKAHALFSERKHLFEGFEVVGSRSFSDQASGTWCGRAGGRRSGYLRPEQCRGSRVCFCTARYFLPPSPSALLPRVRPFGAGLFSAAPRWRSERSALLGVVAA